MPTKQSRTARRQRWADGSDHVAPKAKKGRTLEGGERVAVIQRLEERKRRDAEVARKVATAMVKVDRRIEERMTSTPGNKPFAGRSRGMGDALAESNARNRVAAQIAERRAEQAERLQLRETRRLCRAADEQAAVERAWDNRVDVRPLIEADLKHKTSS